MGVVSLWVSDHTPPNWLPIPPVVGYLPLSQWEAEVMCRHPCIPDLRPGSEQNTGLPGQDRCHLPFRGRPKSWLLLIPLSQNSVIKKIGILTLPAEGYSEDYIRSCK